MVIVKQMSDVPATDLSPEAEVVGVVKQVLIGPADHAPTFAVRLFTLAPGGSTPFHSHPFEHGVIVLRGTGTVRTADGPQAMGEGSVVFVPPDAPHQFQNTGSIALQFLCIVPVRVET